MRVFLIVLAACAGACALPAAPASAQADITDEVAQALGVASEPTATTHTPSPTPDDSTADAPTPVSDPVAVTGYAADATMLPASTVAIPPPCETLLGNGDCVEAVTTLVFDLYDRVCGIAPSEAASSSTSIQAPEVCGKSPAEIIADGEAFAAYLTTLVSGLYGELCTITPSMSAAMSASTLVVPNVCGKTTAEIVADGEAFAGFLLALVGGVYQQVCQLAPQMTTTSSVSTPTVCGQALADVVDALTDLIGAPSCPFGGGPVDFTCVQRIAALVTPGVSLTGLLCSLDSSYCPPSDQDGDGVPDSSDNCPYQAGPSGNRGCPPDRDGDGMPDQYDACPDTYASGSEDGCPDDFDDPGPNEDVPEEEGPTDWGDGDEWNGNTSETHDNTETGGGGDGSNAMASQVHCDHDDSVYGDTYFEMAGPDTSIDLSSYVTAENALIQTLSIPAMPTLSVANFREEFRSDDMRSFVMLRNGTVQARLILADYPSLGGWAPYRFIACSKVLNGGIAAQ